MGFKNKSFLIEDSQKNKYVLKIYALNFLTDETIEEYAKILNQLKKEGVPVIEIIKGLNNKFLQKVEYHNIHYQTVISKFVELSEFSERYLNKPIVENIAKTLSQLHKCLYKINPPENTRVFKPIETLENMLSEDSISKIRDAFKTNSHRPHRLENYIQTYIEDGKRLLTYFKKREKILSNPKLIHGDFQVVNLNIQNDKVKTIFDFDEMSLAPITFELGCSLMHLDEGLMLTEDLIETFIKKYRSYSRIEKEEVLDILMFMQYRAFYRVSRWFTYYRFSSNPSENFSKYQYKLDRYKQLNLKELVKFIEE